MTKWIGILFAFTLFSASSAFAANVLILDDDYGTEVSNDLTTAGHTVSSIAYYDWDGSNPALMGFDAVILLKGRTNLHEIGNDENSPTYQALLQFVQNGGIFVSTEWLIYDMGHSGLNLAMDPLVPFSYASYEDYNYAGSYSVVAPGDPLAAGLPSSWDTYDNAADGGSCADLKPGATVVINRDMDRFDNGCMAAFALAYINLGQGVSIHLNSDLGHYARLDAPPELLQILRNAVALSENRAPTPAAIPVTTPLGLLLMSVLLGWLGVRRMRSQA